MITGIFIGMVVMLIFSIITIYTICYFFNASIIISWGKPGSSWLDDDEIYEIEKISKV